MSLRRNLARLLDRPGGRSILGILATRLARGQGGDEIEVFYDRLWIHRVGHIEFPDGRRFNYPFSAFSLWKNQSKECLFNAEDCWFRYYRPQTGDVVIDVGAGRGEDTLAFSQAVGETGRVIAIEAHPLSFEILEDFCRRNRLTNTTPLQVAVMDKSGSVSLTESEVWCDATVARGIGSMAFEVRAATLDEICEVEAVNKVSLLKMNIEGAERYALSGMQSVIKRVQTICVACHDFRADRGDGEQFRTRAFVEQFLTEHGFKLASRPHDPRNYVRDHIVGLR